MQSLCEQHCASLSDSYKLGIRGDKIYLLDKYQMIQEIRNNTETGKFLVKRYKKFLENVEQLLD
jgi:hypothetical protein